MVSKTRSKGFSIVEVLVVVFILLIMFALTLLYVSPVKNRQRARDNKRLSDLETLDRVVNEYVLDNESYPDISGVLRNSTALPPGSTQLESALGGWISVDFTNYLSMLPIDPINDSEYRYFYTHNDTGYEINAKLEYQLDLMENDGGNDPTLYEIGNNLAIISP